MPTLLFLLACVPAWPSPEGDGVVLILRDRALIRGASPRLGDLAEVTGTDKGATARIAAIPMKLPPGTRLLSRADLENLIRSENPDLDGFTIEGASLSRVSVGIEGPDADQITNLLKAHLASVTPWREDEIFVRLRQGFDGLGLPDGRIEYRVANRALQGATKNPLVPFEALLEGKLVRTFWVRAEVRIVARVVKAVNRIAYRAAIRPADLDEVVCEIEDPGSTYLRSAVEAAGSVAKRALAPGELIRKDWLEAKRMVRKGDTVRLLAVRDAVTLTVAARALQDGRLGEQIRVQNLDFNRPVTAQVTGEREVRVEY